jgi:6-pyruvoyltetrahydropterin/6-carboxytetrahydropterin synthase
MPNVTLRKEFTFEAAHRLPYVPHGHKCGRLHGHSFRFFVTIRGPVNAGTGMVVDYAEISAVVKPIVEESLDHRYLNEIDGLENPTAENLAIWLWNRIIEARPWWFWYVESIEVCETCTSSALYKGD